jgi:Prokaryotic glutathione synthetase, ATP-grasp domain
VFLEAGQPLPAVSWERAFLKPAVGATAEHTLRFRADAEGLAAAREHLRAHGDKAFLLQPYVASVETDGERSAIAIEGELSHCVCKLPVPGDYRVQDDYGATDRAHDPSPAEQVFVARVLESIGERLLYVRIDWLIQRGEPVLIELEAVEPCLFFRHGPQAAERLAAAIVARLTR